MNCNISAFLGLRLYLFMTDTELFSSFVYVLLLIIIIIIIISSSRVFSTPALTDGFSLKSEGLQVSSGFQDLANFNNAVVSMDSILHLIASSSSLFSRFSETLPRAPTSIVIPVTFMFHNSFNCHVISHWDDGSGMTAVWINSRTWWHLVAPRNRPTRGRKREAKWLAGTPKTEVGTPSPQRK